MNINKTIALIFFLFIGCTNVIFGCFDYEPSAVHLIKDTGTARLAVGPGLTGSSFFTLVPYASGSPINVTNFADGSPSTGSVVAFGGNTVTDVDVSSGTVEITDNENFAFYMANGGTISSISVWFYLTSTANPFFLNRLILTGQIYVANPPSNIFTPLEGAEVSLRFIQQRIGDLVPGIVKRRIREVNIPIQTGMRVLLVFTVKNLGSETMVNNFSGYVSGAVVITD